MHSQIKGSELLTNIFGTWPSFHDAEVVRVALDRTGLYGKGPDFLAEIYVFEMTPEVDARGHFVLRHEVLVSFRFNGIDQLKLEDFGIQNVLMGLGITDIRSKQLESSRFEVSFDGCFGMSATFLCREVHVESVRPWEPRQDSQGNP